MPETLRLVVRLPQPLGEVTWPPSAFCLFQPQWLPLSFIELDSSELPALEELFGPEAVRYFESIELELCQGIDACLTEAEKLIHPRPNGLQGRGGEGRDWGHEGYPVMTAAGQIAGDPGLELETPGCRFVGLNLSKHTAPAEFDPTSPLSVATQITAQQLLVILAAGNEGERTDTEDTRSPWARAPWVLAVGATEDEAGTRIAPYSGRSADDSNPELYAWGVAGQLASEIGTSYAAPRVGREALVLAAWLETLRHAVSVTREEGSRGIPLIGMAMVDSGAPRWPSNQLPLPAYPFLGIDEGHLAEAMLALGPGRDQLELAPTPARLQEVLVRSARPIPTAPSARFVCRETTRGYLARFDGVELARIGLGQDVEPAPGLDKPLAQQGELEQAIEIFDKGSLHLYYEQETGVTTWN